MKNNFGKINRKTMSRALFEIEKIYKNQSYRYDMIEKILVKELDIRKLTDFWMLNGALIFIYYVDWFSELFWKWKKYKVRDYFLDYFYKFSLEKIKKYLAMSEEERIVDLQYIDDDFFNPILRKRKELSEYKIYFDNYEIDEDWGLIEETINWKKVEISIDIEEHGIASINSIKIDWIEKIKDNIFLDEDDNFIDIKKYL